MTLRKRRFPNISFIRDVGYLFPPYRHFERSEKSSLHSALSCPFRGSFPLFRAFLFPSQKHSRFLLSHIRRYTGVQERSLGFARDDDTRIAFYKHIRCTLRGITPFPPYRHFERSEKSSLHSVLSCSFRKRVPLFRAFLFPSQKHSRFLLSHIRRYTGVQERSLGFARDDVA